MTDLAATPGVGWSQLVIPPMGAPARCDRRGGRPGRNFGPVWRVLDQHVRTLVGLTGATVCIAAAPADASITPPANSGCGENGPTMSSERPSVTLPSSLTLRYTGRVRTRLQDANQTAAAAVRIRQSGGRLVGGNTNHTYTCIDGSRRTSVAAVPLTDYGRRLVRRRGTLRVTLTFRLINGSGVTHTISQAAVIRPER